MLIRESRSTPAPNASGQRDGRGGEKWLGGRHDLDGAWGTLRRSGNMIIPVIEEED